MTHRRRSIRLRHYDYASAGAYFVTICTHERAYLFGEVVQGEMRVNQFGQVVADEWARSAIIRHEIVLDAWIVMPNHLHGIVLFLDTNNASRGRHGNAPLGNVSTVGAHGDAPPPPADNPSLVGAHGRAPLRRPPRSLPSFIAGFKSAVTLRVNALRGTPGLPVWQRNYYEHVIRDDECLADVRAYIAQNPARWLEDEYGPRTVVPG